MTISSTLLERAGIHVSPEEFEHLVIAAVEQVAPARVSDPGRDLTRDQRAVLIRGGIDPLTAPVAATDRTDRRRAVPRSTRRFWRPASVSRRPRAASAWTRAGCGRGSMPEPCTRSSRARPGEWRASSSWTTSWCPASTGSYRAWVPGSRRSPWSRGSSGPARTWWIIRG